MTFPSTPCEIRVAQFLAQRGVSAISPELANLISASCRWGSAPIVSLHIYRCVSWLPVLAKLKEHDPDMTEDQLIQLEVSHHQGDRQAFIDLLTSVRSQIKATQGVSSIAKQNVIGNMNKMKWEQRLEELADAHTLSDLTLDDLFYDLIILEHSITTAQAKAATLSGFVPPKPT